MQAVAVKVAPTTMSGTTVYRVRLGPVADVPGADSISQTMVDAGLERPQIVIE